MTIETVKVVKTVELYTINGKVNSACVSMGYATLDLEALGLNLPVKQAVNYPISIAGSDYAIICVDMGNPHCLVFFPSVDAVDVENMGPLFEHADHFPHRLNTEFIRVVDQNTIKMRVW